MKYLKMKNKNKVWKKSGKANSCLHLDKIELIPKCKRSQITVFIILAILIVGVLFLLFYNKTEIGSIFTKSESPVDKIQDCIKDSAEEGIIILSNQGGSINPVNYYLFGGNKIEYMCYTEQYYQKCVMQKPLLKQDIEKELKNYLEPKIINCIDSVKSSLENQGYIVNYKNTETSVKLIPSSILIETNAELKVSKASTSSYKSIKTDVSSRLYEFAMTASSIANWEARYGDSETMAYMLYYPTLKVEKKIKSDGTRIYILTDRESGEKFMFAIRSVAIPSGMTGK